MDTRLFLLPPYESGNEANLMGDYSDNLVCFEMTTQTGNSMKTEELQWGKEARWLLANDPMMILKQPLVLCYSVGWWQLTECPTSTTTASWMKSYFWVMSCFPNQQMNCQIGIQLHYWYWRTVCISSLTCLGLWTLGTHTSPHFLIFHFLVTHQKGAAQLHHF